MPYSLIHAALYAVSRRVWSVSSVGVLGRVGSSTGVAGAGVSLILVAGLVCFIDGAAPREARFVRYGAKDAPKSDIVSANGRFKARRGG